MKIKSPLLSGAASGNFGDVIQFVCGSFVRTQSSGPSQSTTVQKAIQEKFKQGAAKWTNELGLETKQKWKEFFKLIKQEPQCVETILTMNGYQIWQAFWCKFGEGGWNNYPNPPLD